MNVTVSKCVEATDAKYCVAMATCTHLRHSVNTCSGCTQSSSRTLHTASSEVASAADHTRQPLVLSQVPQLTHQPECEGEEGHGAGLVGGGQGGGDKVHQGGDPQSHLHSKLEWEWEHSHATLHRHSIHTIGIFYAHTKCVTLSDR